MAQEGGRGKRSYTRLAVVVGGKVPSQPTILVFIGIVYSYGDKRRVT